MDIGITIDDPKAYTKPWGTTVTVTLLPNTQLMEFICLENEKKTGTKSALVHSVQCSGGFRCALADGSRLSWG